MNPIDIIRANCPDLARRATSVAAMSGDLQRRELDRLIGHALAEAPGTYPLTPDPAWTLQHVATLVAACSDTRHLPLWYSVRDVANITGVQIRTIQRRCEEGTIPGAYRLALDATTTDPAPSRTEWRLPPLAIPTITPAPRGRPRNPTDD